MPLRVAIVEDDPRWRANIEMLLRETDGLECVGSYPSGEAAVAELPKRRAQVVLMDINLPRMSGVECTRQLRALLPDIQIVMLTVYDDSDRIFQALQMGANGYLLKRASADEILQAIQDVHRGGAPMSAYIARKVVQSFQRAPASNEPTEDLSPREKEVLDCLAQGFLYKEIADKLGISYETVHTYIRRIYEKLQVRTRTEAVAKFLRR